MKKVLVILLVLMLSFSFASCKAEKENADNTVPVSGTGQTGEGVPAAEPAPESENVPESETVQNDEALKGAWEGKVTGIEAGIGSRLQDVIAELGEPSALDYYEGISFVSYEIVDIMLDRIIDDTKEEAYVSGIIVSEGYELYGVKVGMNPEQIKAYLGAPVKEGLDADGEGDLWKVDYDCGDYLLSFFAPDKDSATLSAYLTKKQ